MHAACLDIGGTFIKYGIISEKGKVIFNSKERTNRGSREELVTQIINIIEGLINNNSLKIKGIGISTAGQVNYKTGEIIFATDSFPGWTGTPLGKIVSSRFNMPCYVENDVNAAALGELHFGAAKGYENFLCFAIGTGVGGGIVLNGKLYHGHNSLAGEFGHMIINQKGKGCSCKNNGCYEQYASVSSLIGTAKENLSKEYYNENLGAEWLFERYTENEVIREIVDNYLLNVATGIVNLIHILNPEGIVIGGAISENKQLLETVERHVKTMAMESFTKDIKIEAASLKNNAAMYGAASYVFEREKIN